MKTQRMRISIDLGKLRDKSYLLGGSRVVSWNEVEKFLARSVAEGFDTLVFMDEPVCGLCDQGVPVEGNRHALYKPHPHNRTPIYVLCTGTARSKA